MINVLFACNEGTTGKYPCAVSSLFDFMSVGWS